MQLGLNATMHSSQAPPSARKIMIHAWLPAVQDILGPGLRAVVWVQGCSLHCPGCIVPEMWKREDGLLTDALSLANDILQRTDIEGVTVSGGEPTEQPAAVALLLQMAKAAGKNTWVYSGHTLESLIAKNEADIDLMLAHTDVLVDGRYIQKQGGVFSFRGSVNQRIIRLTDAIAAERIYIDDGARLEITLTSNGRLVLVGIPPPKFMGRFRKLLEERGLAIQGEFFHDNLAE